MPTLNPLNLPKVYIYDMLTGKAKGSNEPMLIPCQAQIKGGNIMWKEVKGYEGLYWVSENGEIKNAKEQMKTQKEDKDGYRKVWLSKSSKKTPFFVHRLVAMAFLENPNNKPIVNHVNGNKKNNHISNLEWCTRSENDKHAFKLGLRKPTCGGTSKQVEQYDMQGNLIATYNSISHASRETNFTIANISYNANGHSKHANGYIWRFAKV